jgi:periplasmic protein TonB
VTGHDYFFGKLLAASNLKYMSTDTSINLLLPYPQAKPYAGLLEMIQQRKIIFICTLFSILLHILFLVRFSGLENKSHSDIPVSHSVNISLSRYIPEEAPQTQHENKPVKKKLVKKVNPLESQVVAPAEIQSAIEETKKEERVVEEEPIIEESFVQNQATNVPVDPALLVNEKAQYIEAIAAHLDKHKFYPRSARRRHIEGDVKISFGLLLDGNIINLKILSAHTSLEKASSESIHNALPMPPRPENLLALNTIQIEYTMQFAMKQ